jgi:hypothetical protein
MGSSLGFGISGGGNASPSNVAQSAGSGSGTADKTTSGPSAGKGPTGTPATAVTPAFKFGHSAALGTRIPGAFSPTLNNSLKASSLQHGSLQLRTPSAAPESQVGTGSTNIRAAGSARPRSQQGVSVAALLNNSSDRGVGFD